MSGGGGGWERWNRMNPIIRKRPPVDVASSEYEAEANGFLQDLLASYNQRDADAIRRHVETLQQAIESEIDGETTTLFGGSVKKHTYVDGLSDVDVLFIVNDSELANATPRTLLQYFRDRIMERLPNTNVEVGTLAVSVKYADGIEIQVLPALRTATGVRIAIPGGSGWSGVVRPDAFAEKITTLNQSNAGKLVPVIKLFKGLQASLPENCQLTGYHVESLAIEAFRDYAGRLTYKDMLLHLIRNAATRVTTAITDTTGQSFHVDDYMGAGSSPARLRAAKALKRLGDRLAAADTRQSVDAIKALFGE